MRVDSSLEAQRYPTAPEGETVMDHRKEAAVRARAYQLWVESGYADGYQDQHWRQAEREFDERSAAEETSAAAAPIRIDVAPRLHMDGMSLHPSVLDPAPARHAS